VLPATAAPDHVDTADVPDAPEPEPPEPAPPRYRRPQARDGDGAVLWQLSQAAGGLDANSEYAYHMLAEYYPDTCVIAERDGRPVGFVTGFRPPSAPGTLFVWQIAVDPQSRGRGVARGMLNALLDRLVTDGVQYLEATITPSNAASRHTFHAVARRFNATCEESPLFWGDSFVSGKHEDEFRYRIGPFRRTPGAGSRKETAHV
jgi:L-2,4-diaminobutyric acid acetyltransferase